MRYFESPAFGEWCKRVYGSDMKQMGAVTTDELELFYREVDLPHNSNILDIGCGSGYITAAVSEYYKSFVRGIDIDKDAIGHAKKTFSNYKLLSFEISDAFKFTYNTESVDLICFFDTLYISGNIKKLRQLLDKSYCMLKPGGKLAVFWSNHPNTSFDIFDMSVPSADSTQVGIWGIDNHIQFKSYDLTQSHRLFWQKAMMEIKAMELELSEEVPEQYAQIFSECVRAIQSFGKDDAGGLFRWLYVFNKQ